MTRSHVRRLSALQRVEPPRSMQHNSQNSPMWAMAYGTPRQRETWVGGSSELARANRRIAYVKLAPGWSYRTTVRPRDFWTYWLTEKPRSDFRSHRKAGAQSFDIDLQAKRRS